MQLARAEVERGTELAQKGYLPLREVEARRLAALAAEQEVAGLRRQQATIERDIADIESRLASIPLDINAARSEAQTPRPRCNNASPSPRHAVCSSSPRPSAVGSRRFRLPGSAHPDRAATVAVIIPTGGTTWRPNCWRLSLDRIRATGSGGRAEPAGVSLPAIRHRPGHGPHGIEHGSGAARSVIRDFIIKEPVFRIRVSLSREAMQAYGQAIPMQPGMLVSAEIVFDRRSLLQWLFDPIYAVGRRS